MVSQLRLTDANYLNIFDAARRLPTPVPTPEIAVGSKRPRSPSPSSSSSHTDKRPRIDFDKPLRVLTFVTTLIQQPQAIPHSQRARTRAPLEALYDHLSSNRHAQHPTTLSKVDLRHQGKYPHDGVQVRLEESREDHSLKALLTFDPFEEEGDGTGVKRKWNKTGKTMSNRGQGGLLDCIVALEHYNWTGVKAEHSLSVETVEIDDREEEGEEEHELIFHITTTVYLHSNFFEPIPTLSIPKQFLIRYLFPPSPDSHAFPGEVTVDTFYSTLQRASITSSGVPLPSLQLDNVKRKSLDISEEAKRRKEKGKGKARDQDDVFSDQEEDEDLYEVEKEGEEEDELVRPDGLEAKLMPFQSRTVRWMLGREGKIVLPGLPVEEEEAPREVVDDDEMEQDLPPLSKSLVGDLPPDILKDFKRGPLWERVKLTLVDEEEPIELWLNRVGNSVALTDPADDSVEVEELEKVKGKEKAAEQEEEEEVVMDTDSDADSSVIVEAPARRDSLEEMKEDKLVVKKRRAENNLGRSLVAEEMGLGKTMEVISLILLHRRPERNNLPTYHNLEVDSQVQPSAMTLVVAPAAIVNQWSSEIAKFAPSLRVLRYESIKSISESTTPQDLNKEYDIFLTTFDVLRKEVALARKPHQRSLRSGRETRHKYRRSMLVQLDFLRVVIDEIQMVGDAMSASSETASLIPRLYSLAVTGTPVNKIDDLYSLLRFLQIEPVGSNRSLFAKLLQEGPSFVRLCQQLFTRTLKVQVQHELVIPRQERFVVPLELSVVERYWYDTRYREALDQLGLEPDGTPREDCLDKEGNLVWTPDKGDMNRWLVSLRQICGHPQIGQGGRQRLGNVLKTVDDVLSTMRENAVSAVHSDLRALWSSRAKRGQLLLWDREECERFEGALEILQDVVLDVQPVIDEVAELIRSAWQDKKAEKAKRARSASTASASEDGGGIGGALLLGFDEEEINTDGIPQSDRERALTARLTGLRSRLRELLLVQHAARFFTGSAYFNLGKFEKEETEAYGLAEGLRQTLLGPYETRVEKSAVRLKGQLESRDKDGELALDDLEFDFSKMGGGLVARETFEAIDVTSDILNGWAELIWQWRDMVLQMLYTRVSIAGDNATGDEYAERAELQEKLDCYLQAYGILLSDWRSALTGEKSALADVLDLEALDFAEKRHEIVAADGSKRKRGKQNEKKRIPLKDRMKPSLALGDTPADILRYELLEERVHAKGDDQEEVEPVPIRHLIGQLKDATDQRLRAEEKELMESEAKRLRKILAAKEKILDRLRTELADMTKAHNCRIEYFAQLQAISDDVADPKFESNKWKGLQAEMAIRAEEEEKLEEGLKKKMSQRRYLESLEDSSLAGNEETYCIICQDSYTKGVLTSCGHIFCQTCFNAWNHQSHTCAICKKVLRSSDYEIVRYKRKDAPVVPVDATAPRHTNTVGSSGPLDPEKPVKLRMIISEDLEMIEEVATANPLSSKSDLIVKHVKYLRREDPTTKIVIFSAWTESLSILQQAFARNGIGFVRLEGPGSGKRENVVTKFRSDPDVAVFFLHTKSQSAGLNLTCAQYVFLVEPLLHPALEMQAVARVHRVGQTQETTVFQYFVSDTVDQRVAELRGRQRSSLFLPTEIDVARETKILQEDMKASGPVSPSKNKGKSSEEAIEDEDDISRCLFEPAHFLSLQRAMLPTHLRGSSPSPSRNENIERSQVMDVDVTPGMRAAEAAVRRQHQAEGSSSAAMEVGGSSS